MFLGYCPNHLVLHGRQLLIFVFCGAQRVTLSCVVVPIFVVFILVEISFVSFYFNSINWQFDVNLLSCLVEFILFSIFALHNIFFCYKYFILSTKKVSLFFKGNFQNVTNVERRKQFFTQHAQVLK